jgi:putative NADH-flavin reductase
MDQLPAGGSSISVEDVAGFMLSDLADATHFGRRVGVAY